MNSRFIQRKIISKASIMNRFQSESLVVFILDGQSFGINTNLVHSFIPAGFPILEQDIHPALSGFLLWTATRDASSAIPLLNIAHLLGKREPQSSETAILCEWHQSLFAFHVDKIDGIYTIALQDQFTDKSHNHVPSLLINGVQVQLPDFHSLTNGVIRVLQEKQKAARQQKHILLVHNSALLREALTTALRANGYTSLTELDDYSKAYPYVFTKYASGCFPDLLIIGSTGHYPALTDLQSLICTIKAQLRFRSLPTVLLTDHYHQTQHPEFNAQVRPFNFTELIEQSDALTGVFASLIKQNSKGR